MADESVPVVPFPSQASHRNKKKHRPRKDAPPKYTLADAFDYFHGPIDERGDSPFQSERCVRAVAFLLHYCSEYGNDNVNGFAAHGLGHVLEKCAGKIALAEEHRKWLRKQEQERGQ